MTRGGDVDLQALAAETQAMIKLQQLYRLTKNRTPEKQSLRHKLNLAEAKVAERLESLGYPVALEEDQP